MSRTTHLVFAAGIVGAVFASVLTHALSTPAQAAPGWGVSEVRVATVDVLALLERMLDTEAYSSARDASSKVWNDQIQPLISERDGLVQTLQQMDPNDPNAQGLYEQYQGLQQRINAMSQEAGQAIDVLSAQQLASAYKVIHAAVQTVAAAQGFERVFASRMTTDDMNADNTNVIVQEVLLRPILTNTGGEDITPLLAEHLALPEEVATPAVGPEPAPVDPAGDGQPDDGQ